MFATSPPARKNPNLEELGKPKSLILEDSSDFQASLTKTLSGINGPVPTLVPHHHDHHHHDAGIVYCFFYYMQYLYRLMHMFITDIDHVNVDTYGLTTKVIYRNASVPLLYEQALARETGSALTSTGALVTSSGAKTGI